MKWIAVILVLLNVVAYLLGMRMPAEVVQTVQSGEYEQINVAAMSVIRPDEQRAQEEKLASDVSTLEEESLAQLKVNQKGQVLMAKNEQLEENKIKAIDAPPQVKAKLPPVRQDEQAEDKKKVAVSEVEKPVTTASVEPVTAKPASAEAALACYRLGPFKNPKRLTNLRQRLKTQGITYKLDESEATRQVKAVRVYVGPFADDAGIKQQKQQLEKMKIDHFLIRIKGKPLLQLGYFSEPERAANFQKQLKAKGLPVKVDTIYLEGSINNSLELTQVSEKAIKALDISKGIKVQSKPCQ